MCSYPASFQTWIALAVHLVATLTTVYAWSYATSPLQATGGSQQQQQRMCFVVNAKVLSLCGLVTVLAMAATAVQLRSQLLCFLVVVGACLHLAVAGERLPATSRPWGITSNAASHAVKWPKWPLT